MKDFFEVPPRFAAFSSLGKKIMVLNPSSRVQADVHRTSAFNLSNLVGPFSPNKKDIQLDVLFVWRYRPDLNWGMRVLQTLALPLGHGTI